MGILNWIGDLFKPAADLIDNVHTSTEEKMQLKNALAGIQEKANAKFIELELAKVTAQKEIIMAESKSQYWLTANWRPVCSIAITGLIIADSLGWANAGPGIYTLATTFLGVYAGGRSLEKTANVVKLGK